MNKPQGLSNEQMVKILKRVRFWLSTRTRSFVCTSAQYAYERNEISNWEHQLFIKFINNRICGCVTVTVWLQKQKFDVGSNVEIWRQYRLRWVDSMIEEFSV